MANLSRALRHRLDNPQLTALFEQVGRTTYRAAVEHLADQLASVLAEGAKSVHQQIEDQHGKHGLKQALPQLEAWAVEIAEAVLTDGVDDILEQVRHAIHGTKLPTTQ